ncbi:MAG: sugar transporter [Rhodobacteraceae bacterium]|nr:MAG: sugar transporter [Paracoccaceae bacterium]
MAQQKNDLKVTHLPPVEARLPERAAMKARMRRRHWRLVFGLFLIVGLPVLVVALYLTQIARPQYASETGFVIRQEEAGSASQMLGGLSAMLGQNVSGNSDLLFEFLQSQEIVALVQGEIDLRAHYADGWPEDPLFTLPPDALIEDLVTFWQRMVRLTYDRSTGVITVQVRARDAQTAQAIAAAILRHSENVINDLNATARRDSMANAQADLEDAVATLRRAREALLAFQARTKIVDPMADMQGRMGILGNLQAQLAEAFVDYDLLSQTAAESDPRLRHLDRRITAIEDRIAHERSSFSAQNVTVDNTDYPTLLAEYESLRADVDFAAETYRAALAALAHARTRAARQQLYLATFLRPTLPQRALYPQAGLLTALTGFFAFMVWSVLALVYYSLRDRG